MSILGNMRQVLMPSREYIRTSECSTQFRVFCVCCSFRFLLFFCWGFFSCSFPPPWLKKQFIFILTRFLASQDSENKNPCWLSRAEFQSSLQSESYDVIVIFVGLCMEVSSNYAYTFQQVYSCALNICFNVCRNSLVDRLNFYKAKNPLNS